MKTQRLPKGSPYFFITANVMGTRLSVEKGYDFHHEQEDKRYAAGNYFESEEKAMKACAAIRQAVRENDVETNIIKNLQDQVKMLKKQRRILRSSNEKFRQKATKWLEECLPDIEYITNASALRQTKKQFISSFCKAMNS